MVNATIVMSRDTKIRPCQVSEGTNVYKKLLLVKLVRVQTKGKVHQVLPPCLLLGCVQYEKMEWKEKETKIRKEWKGKERN